MSRLLTVVFILAVLVIGVGFYRGWFTLSSGSPDGDNDQVDVNLRVDRDKMREDAASVRKQTGEIVGSKPAEPVATPAEKQP